MSTAFCRVCKGETESRNYGTDLDPAWWCVTCWNRPTNWADYTDPLDEQTSYEDYRDRCDQLEEQLNTVREIG